jgi:hypothetical protein
MDAPIEANTQSRGDIPWFDILDEAKLLSSGTRSSKVALRSLIGCEWSLEGVSRFRRNLCVYSRDGLRTGNSLCHYQPRVQNKTGEGNNCVTFVLTTLFIYDREHSPHFLWVIKFTSTDVY